MDCKKEKRMKNTAETKSLVSMEKCKFVFQTVIIFESLMQLTHSDAYFSPYLLMYALGYFAFAHLYRFGKMTGECLSLSRRQHRICNNAGGCFAILISAANYSIWLEPSLGGNTPAVMRFAYGFMLLVIISSGSFLVFRSLFRFFAVRTNAVTWKRVSYPDSRIWKPKSLFYISFFGISLVYLFVLFLIKYPGLLVPDTITQFTECLTGEYSNKNPLFSTLIIKPFITVGMAVFHNVNACAAMFCAAQVLLVAFCFACVVETLAEMKAPIWILCCTLLYYALMPYHIMFTIGHSKNVQFSVSVTLFCLILYRLLKQPNAPRKWYFFLFLISVCFCVMRNNGILAFLFFIPVYYFTFKRGNKRILTVMIFALLLSFGVTRPLLRVLEIPQSDWIESLSLPTQQVARAVIAHNDLTEAEMEALNPIMNVEEISQSYNAGISDPLKAMIRQTMRENPTNTSAADFLKLWVQLGLRHPVTYAKAFVDLTCGYWNSGYHGSTWTNFIYENYLGLYLTNPVPILNTLFDRFIGLFDDIFTLQLTICTGFFVWLYLFSCVFCIIRKDKLGAILCAPVLCVVQTLLLGVPVACDMGYIYCAFCALPFVLAVSTRKNLD